jgi:DNA polymerase elongation subunit (family B)
LSDWKSSFVKLNPVRGWLFDVYPSGTNEIVVWIIAENGSRIRLVDKYAHKIYVSGDPLELKHLATKIRDNQVVVDWRFVRKYADFMNTRAQKVLEIEISDNEQALDFARTLLSARANFCHDSEMSEYGKFRLCNVDVPVSQAYLYDKDIFPLAHVMVVDLGKRLSYDLLDSVENVDYQIPPLRSMQLSASVKKEGVLQKLSDKIDSIALECGDGSIVISDGDEDEKLLELVKTVKEMDPDLILTHGGDSFLFPYLAYRAFANGVLEDFVLSRDNIPLRANRSRGQTFFSYGRVYHKAPMRRLFGRVHIDVKNTFIHTACGLEGLIEVSRTCRVPLQRAARASIGSIMSSLQLYTAWQNDILIPWKKGEPEYFKSAWELLIADRGGFVFEPKLGFHADVVEVDFTSMFPMLMLTRNISAETVLCRCCPNSSLRVPELGYNICEKRRGIVPKTLDLLLKKRLQYKSLVREAENKELKHVYNMRQSALKWILVTCFGYLGYRNARFGKVDAHIAVCAFARDALLRTARIAEDHGFEVIHGIVDSLWLKKQGFLPKEVVDFCHEVSSVINVPLEVEGKYRWIVFLPSKTFEGVPVLNRYYGVFGNGEVKMRGVEARRGDTPYFIVQAQMAMIKKLAEANSLESFKEKTPESLHILGDYADKLIEGQVDAQELLVTKRLSKSPLGYSHDVFQAIAAKQLEKAGFEVHAGQTVQYLILNADATQANRRVIAAQLLKPNMHYDVDEYLKLLLSAGETLLAGFGYTRESIQAEAINHEKQTMIL